MGSYGSYYNAWEGMGISFGENRRREPKNHHKAVILSVANASRMRSSGAVESLP